MPFSRVKGHLTLSKEEKSAEKEKKVVLGSRKW